MLSVSLIIPTYKRYDDLKRTLQSLRFQSYMPIEVLVIIGPNDEKSQKICESFITELPMIKIFSSSIPSVINALNIGLSSAKGDVVSLTDDDVEFPINWLLNISNYFYLHKDVGIYGGPDKLQIFGNKYINTEIPQKKVGLFTQWGMIGSHHCGIVNSPANVDVIKGVNLSFRNSALKIKQIDPFLISYGAETCWEIDLCQTIKKAGYRIVYDNDNFLIHYIGKRVGDDNRNDLFSKSIYFRVRNNAYVYAKFRPFNEIIGFLIHDFLIGSRTQPGFFRAFLYLTKYGLQVFGLYPRRIRPTIKGLKAGFSSAYKNSI